MARWAVVLILVTLAEPTRLETRIDEGACSSPVHREFDFWLGNWDVFDRNSPTKSATVRVTKELDGCVLREEYDGLDGLRGTSLSSYDGTALEWQQTWVTNRAQLLVVHGHRDGDALVFTGWLREKNGEVSVRARWTPEPAGVRETAERSTDGGHSWRPWFDLSFRPASR
ncbi:MAG: hypothetical protein U0Q12_14120 [Vicinamibacterales bacterium]